MSEPITNRSQIDGMVFSALLNRVHVRVLDIEEVSKAGIVLATGASKHKEQMGCDVGVIIDLGPDAFDEYKDKRVKPGDVVIFAQYGGKVVPDTDGKERILNDVDLIAIGRRPE